MAPLKPEDAARGHFFARGAIWIDGIQRSKPRPSAGPPRRPLHSDRLDEVLAAIGDAGYGLTLGLQTRIDETVERVRQASRVGNFYVNRTMIGAAVGTQPFGGEFPLRHRPQGRRTELCEAVRRGADPDHQHHRRGRKRLASDGFC